MNFRPNADRLVVKQSESESVSKGGIFIPDASVQKVNRGTVMAIGPGRITESGTVVPISDIAVNDIVMFNQGAGAKVTVDGQEFLVLKEEEILAVVE